MVQTIVPFGALFTATLMLLTGNGLLGTLLSTRMALTGFSTAVSGVVLACYFMGLPAGSMLCKGIIQRVGHIRAFTVFAAIATAAALLFAYSIGASLSPILASGVMTLLKTPFGLFVFWAIANAALAGIALYLRKREKIEIVPVEEQVAFVPMKSTTPVATALDPRTEPDTDGK